MNDEKIKLATEISEILKDTNLSTEERLVKMKAKLDPNLLIESADIIKESKETASATYDSQTIKKAALRNQLINKNQI